MSDTPLIYLSGVFKVGALRGKVHQFKAGEGLPLHEHVDTANHITVVLSGRFRVFGRPAIEGAIIKTGDVLEWKACESHGFEALEDGSSFLQVAKW